MLETCGVTAHTGCRNSFRSSQLVLPRGHNTSRLPTESAVVSSSAVDHSTALAMRHGAHYTTRRHSRVIGVSVLVSPALWPAAFSILCLLPLRVTACHEYRICGPVASAHPSYAGSVAVDNNWHQEARYARDGSATAGVPDKGRDDGPCKRYWPVKASSRRQEECAARTTLHLQRAGTNFADSAMASHRSAVSREVKSSS